MSEFEALTLDKGLTQVGLQCSSDVEVIRALAKLLEVGGFVEPSFAEAVVQRERHLPTGLQTKAGGVAIPHTDCRHVRHPALAIGILEHPVDFRNIVAPEELIPVDIVFLIAINKPGAVTPTLAQLAIFLQDADAVDHLRGLRQEQEVVDYMNGMLNPLAREK